MVHDYGFVWSQSSMILPKQKASPFGILLIPTGRMEIFGKLLKGKQVLQGRTCPALVPQPWAFSESYFVENINLLLTTGSLRKCLKSCPQVAVVAGGVSLGLCWGPAAEHRLGCRAGLPLVLCSEAGRIFTLLRGCSWEERGLWGWSLPALTPQRWWSLSQERGHEVN